MKIHEFLDCPPCLIISPDSRISCKLFSLCNRESKRKLLLRKKQSGSRACLKKAFCKMCVTICGRFRPDEGTVAATQPNSGENSAKWGVQIAGMISNRLYSLTVFSSNSFERSVHIFTESLFTRYTGLFILNSFNCSPATIRSRRLNAKCAF